MSEELDKTLSGVGPIHSKCKQADGDGRFFEK